MNLVSEVVINKAFLNQINIQFNDILEHINLTNSEYKDNLKQFNEEILHLLSNHQASNDNIDEIKNNYLQLSRLFDSINTTTKIECKSFKIQFSIAGQNFIIIAGRRNESENGSSETNI